jgi:heparosan-N-sulfate-glucuronate 5-epimerase
MRPRRLTWIITSVSLVLLGLLAFAAWAQPRLTRVDRERLELAQSVPYQTLNLVDHDEPKPRHYYVDMRLIAEYVRTGEYADPPLDKAGVPVVDYTRYEVAGASDARAYNPITTSQYGLALYEEYLRGESDVLEDFYAQADWLVDTMAPDGGLYYQFDLPGRGLEAPWLSGMAQGEAISVLVRAHYESGDPRYLVAARLAFEPLARPFDENGVMHVDHTGTWIEEYPQEPPSHVLNGALFAIFGLYDLERATDDERVGTLLDEAVETLADNLDRYEEDGWVRYQLTGEDAWATRTYYGLHIEQLRALAALSGDERFEHRAERWERPLANERLWLIERAVVRLGEKVRARLGT